MIKNLFKSFIGNEATTEQEETPKTFFLLADYIALNKASKYMWANGYKLEAEETPSKKALQELLDRNEALTLLTQTEFNISKRIEGNQLMYTQPNEDGETMVGLIDMPNESLINADPYGKVCFARTSIEATYGSYQFRIYQVWYPKIMKTYISYRDADGNYNDMDLSKDKDASIYTLIPKSMRFLKEWEYEELPLTLISNYKSIGLTSYGDAYMARDLQFLMDESFISETWELRNNITRVYSSKRDGELKGQIKSNSLFKTRKNTIKTTGAGGDVNSDMEVQQGDPKLESFDNNQLSIFNKYLTAAGYSNENDLEATQTNLGITYTSKADIETTDKKRKDREVQLKQLLKMIIMTHNQFNAPITFEDEPTISILALASIEKENKKADIALMAEHGVLTDDDLLHVFHDATDDDHKEDIKKRIESNTLVKDNTEEEQKEDKDA